jgi:hypothetical protein
MRREPRIPHYGRPPLDPKWATLLLVAIFGLLLYLSVRFHWSLWF